MTFEKSGFLPFSTVVGCSCLDQATKISCRQFVMRDGRESNVIIICVALCRKGPDQLRPLPKEQSPGPAAGTQYYDPASTVSRAQGTATTHSRSRSRLHSTSLHHPHPDYAITRNSPAAQQHAARSLLAAAADEGPKHPLGDAPSYPGSVMDELSSTSNLAVYTRNPGVHG